MLEPAPMADWDMWDMSIYFPEGIESQFGFSAGSSYGFRDQEPSNHFGKKMKNWRWFPCWDQQQLLTNLRAEASWSTGNRGAPRGEFRGCKPSFRGRKMKN